MMSILGTLQWKNKGYEMVRKIHQHIFVLIIFSTDSLRLFSEFFLCLWSPGRKDRIEQKRTLILVFLNYWAYLICFCSYFFLNECAAHGNCFQRKFNHINLYILISKLRKNNFLLSKPRNERNDTRYLIFLSRWGKLDFEPPFSVKKLVKHS